MAKGRTEYKEIILLSGVFSNQYNVKHTQPSNQISALVNLTMNNIYL